MKKLAAEKIIGVGHPPSPAQLAEARRSAVGCVLVASALTIAVVGAATAVWRIAVQ